MRPNEEFSPIRIIRKGLTDSDKTMYKVYKSEEEFVTVEAASALEAFRNSGVENPYKIERDIRFKNRLMNQDRLIETEDVIETVTMQPPEEIQPHQESVPKASEALSQPKAPAQEEEKPKEMVVEADQLHPMKMDETPAEAQAEVVEDAPEPVESEAKPDESELSEADVEALLKGDE